MCTTSSSLAKRPTTASNSPLASIVRTWLPVALWLALIAIESTRALGADHTGLWLYNLADFLHLHLSDRALELANHVLRKSGHFVGYGILGVLFFRAWLCTLRPNLRGLPAVFPALVLAILSTCLTASVDEFHQTFLPNRTGSAWDVALDTMGATVLTTIALPRMRRI